MFSAVSVTGYTPQKINFCPECGTYDFNQTVTHGLYKCGDCGLSCYIIEADDSHEDETESEQ